MSTYFCDSQSSCHYKRLYAEGKFSTMKCKIYKAGVGQMKEPLANRLHCCWLKCVLRSSLPSADIDSPVSVYTERSKASSKDKEIYREETLTAKSDTHDCIFRSVKD